MSSSGVGQLMAKFEKQQPKPPNADGAASKPKATRRPSPPAPTTSNKHAALKPTKSSSSSPSPHGSPKGVSKKLTKQLDSVLASNSQKNAPSSHSQASPPLLQAKKRGNSNASTQQQQGQGPDRTSAGVVALASVLKGPSNHKAGIAKKPLPPVKPLPGQQRGAGRGVGGGENRVKSMNISGGFARNRASNSLESSTSDEESLSVSNRQRRKSAEDGVCEFAGGNAILFSKRDSSKKANNVVGHFRSHDDLDSKTTSPKKPLPVPPKRSPTHLLSPNRESAKSRSTSDLTDIGRTSSDEKRSSILSGPKPPVNRVKPLLVAKPPPTAATRPDLPAAKPVAGVSAKTKPALPLGAKPVLGNKPRVLTGAGKLAPPASSSSSAVSSAPMRRRGLPTPPQKVAQANTLPKDAPTPSATIKSSPPAPPAQRSSAHFAQKTAEKALGLSEPKSPVLKPLPSPPARPHAVSRGREPGRTPSGGGGASDSRSRSDTTDLEQTLRMKSEEGGREELEDTVVEEEKESWIMVDTPHPPSPQSPLKKSKLKLVKKPISSPPGSSKQHTVSAPDVSYERATATRATTTTATTTTTAAATTTAPLPPPPPGRRPPPCPPPFSHKTKPISARGGGGGTDSTAADEVVNSPTRNSLPRSIVSSSSPSPPSPSPFSVAAEGDRPPKSAGAGESKLAAAGTGSPLIRISPSSFSRTIPGSSEPGQSGSEGRPGDTNSRGNVDSGFLSEVPDDLRLLHGTSVESLASGTSEERGGSVYSPPPPLTPDHIEVGELEEEEGEGEEQRKPEPEIWDEARLEKARNKRLNIATELLTTEKTYCSRIKVVAVDFFEVVRQYNSKTKQAIPDSIFLNLKQIHQLNENILQELQKRMDTWSSNEALGDVISRLAPFLKLYATYTSGYEDAVKTLTECTKRDRKFDGVVRDFERSSITTGMGLASFMLEPVQRIPRYRLLLLDYLKYLPPDSPDRTPTQSALRIISEAADHSNDRIKELEISNVILTIQRSLVDYDGTLLAPYRSFVKKGTLLKSSRKTLSPRFFFLFTDILLHTYPPEKEVYKFRNEMPIFGMKVEDPKVSLTPFSFNIYSTTRSLILVACSEEEKRAWITALQSAINDDLKKRSSLRRDAQLQVTKASNLFGTKAPIMVPDKSVTMCQTCSSEFTRIFRRHHCRACGKVVCGNCSQQKAYLPYSRKMERVCTLCFMESKNPYSSRLSGDECTDSPSTSSPVGPRKQDSNSTGTGVLHLKAYEEDAVVAGYVWCQEGKRWNKMWYQVKKDCVLYKFKAHEDIKAVHSMPLPGYAIGSDSKQLSITLTHHSGMKNLCETFRMDTLEMFEKWLEGIRMVIRMEFNIDPTSSHSSIVTSPLAHHTLSFTTSNEEEGEGEGEGEECPTNAPSSRPLSFDSFTSSRPNSFTSSCDSRPTSYRETSPADARESSSER